MRGREFVIDTSVVVKWFIPEDYSDIALMLLEKYKNREIILYAPDSMKIEFANVIRKYYVRGAISEAIMSEIMNAMKKIPIGFIALDWNTIIEATKLAIKYNLTVYDAYYLAIAKKSKIQIITADEKFYNAVYGKEGILLLKNLRA
ncbi:MAG: type II toxin-antitoxin system VapC family toxin [Candidatus Njordarchaeota archaeon]